MEVRRVGWDDKQPVFRPSGRPGASRWPTAGSAAAADSPSPSRTPPPPRPAGSSPPASPRPCGTGTRTGHGRRGCVEPRSGTRPLPRRSRNAWPCGAATAAVRTDESLAQSRRVPIQCGPLRGRHDCDLAVMWKVDQQLDSEPAHRIGSPLRLIWQLKVSAWLCLELITRQAAASDSLGSELTPDFNGFSGRYQDIECVSPNGSGSRFAIRADAHGRIVPLARPIPSLDEHERRLGI